MRMMINKKRCKEKKRNLTKARLINYSIKSQYFHFLYSLVCVCVNAHRNQNRCAAV